MLETHNSAFYASIRVSIALMQGYLREFANYNKSCTDLLEDLRDGFFGQAAMAYTGAVRD